MEQLNSIIYVDMDNVLCDYAEHHAFKKWQQPTIKWPQSIPGFYQSIPVKAGATKGFNYLWDLPETEVYILTAPSILNPHCYMEKRIWVEKYLGMRAVHNLIISPNKSLLKGEWLIDDMACGKGQDEFEGEFLHFGSTEYPDWASIVEYFT